MPLPGFLGFPAFAVECFVMYESVKVLAKGLWGAGRGSQVSESYSSAVRSE